MGKLIKYEWKKQRAARMIMLVLLAVGCLAFLWSMFLGNETASGIVMVLMFSGALLVLLYTGIESIFVLNRDLRTKQSYMLWMVPHSIWEIFGSKFLSALLQMLFAFGVFFAAGCICLAVSILKVGGFAAVLDAAKQFLELTMQVSVSWVDLFNGAVYLFIGWTELIFVGFLAVLLARTVLSRSRFAGILAVILFVVINYVIEKGYWMLNQLPGFHMADYGAFGNVWDIVYYAAVGGILYGVCGWIADHKLSV